MSVYSLTVNPVAPITGTGAICVGQSLTLSNSISGGTWTSSRPSALTVGSASGVVTGMAGGYMPRITYTLGSGCFSTVLVTVNALPSVNPITGSTSVSVSGSPVTLSDFTLSGVWSSGNTSIATVGTSGTVTGVSVGVDVISYSVTNSNSCTGVSTYTITVGPAPLPKVSVNKNILTLCAGSSSYLGEPISGGTYTIVTGEQGIAIVNPETGIVTGLAAGRAEISYTLTDATGTNIYLTNVVVNPLPDDVIISANPGTTIDPGQEVTLKAAVRNGGSLPVYKWMINGVTVQGATSDEFTSSGFASNDSVSCSVSSSAGCGDYAVSNAVIIHLNSLAVKNFSINANITIHPNPSNGHFTIAGTTGSLTDQEVTVEITDMLGQEVYTENITAKNGKIDHQVTLANNLANGMYILNLRTTDGSKIYHFVIEQ
jgi:uncharacterized protein YjdB